MPSINIPSEAVSIALNTMEVGSKARVIQYGDIELWSEQMQKGSADIYLGTKIVARCHIDKVLVGNDFMYSVLEITITEKLYR